MKGFKIRRNVVCRITDGMKFTDADREGIVVRQIVYGDLLKYKCLMKRKAFFGRYLRKGHIGFLVVDLKRDECAGYGWIVIDKAKIGHFNILGKNSAWLHTAFVEPTYRRRGYYKLIMKAKIEYLEKYYRDYDVYVDARHDNIPARKTHKALGFAEAGMYYYLSIGTLRLPYLYIAPGVYLKNKPHPQIQ